MSISTTFRLSLMLAIIGTLARPVSGEQRVDFDRISLDQGLSQSIVEQIVQDQKGFMWFLTEDGLNRFDGYRFTVFRTIPGDSESLSHNELKAVHEDQNGILWVGTFAGGLNRFDPSTEKVTRYLPDSKNPDSLSSASIRCIFEDRAGRLWIGTQGGGLDRLDRSTGIFHHYPANPDVPGTLSHNDVRAIIEDGDGTLWIGTNGGGLDRFDPETGTFTNFHHQPEVPDSLTSDFVFAILEDHTKTLWIGTYGGGLNTLDRATGRFSHFRPDPEDPKTLNSDLIRALCEDHKGTLWVGTDGGGLHRFNRQTSNFESFRHSAIDPHSLSTDRIYSLYQDRSNVLWVGTYGGGLSFFDAAQKNFHHFRNDPSDPNSLSHNIVWSFHEDPDGVLWIGTDSGGLNRFDRSSNRWRRYEHRPDDPRSLSHNTVRALFSDRSGTLWIATNGGGLDRFDRNTESFTHFRHHPDDPDTLGHDELRSIYQDASGALWISTFGGGLDRFDPKTSIFTHFRHDPENPTSISSDFIRLVMEDREGALWVGTQGGGLNRLDSTTGEFSRYRNDSADPFSISSDHVFAIHEDRDGTLWLGTIAGGLNRFDRNTGRFQRYLTAEGLPSDVVYAILEDEEGRLWISTTRGLSRFDPRTESFRNYTVRDGLQSNEFNGGSAYLSPNGEMFFGGIGGFNAFFPQEIGINPEIANIVITDFQLMNQSIGVGQTIEGRVLLRQPITYTDEIELSYRDNVVTLEFAALHFSAPEKNTYSYQMEGFSDDWIPVSADRRYATFTGLTPGEYIFNVRGANCDGVWNLDGTSLKIIVTPPFWATWWFRLAALFALAALLAAGFQYRLRSVRMKTQLIAAHDAQTAIMPQADPDVDGFDISGAWIPAYGVGGDFYDYFWLEGETPRLAIIVADVAGKGMGAAMNAVMSDGMVFSRARQGGSIEEIMGSLNRSLHHKVEGRMFTALCLMVLEPATRELCFVNAGLCEPLHRTEKLVNYLNSPGDRFPLGAVHEANFESKRALLSEGDVIVLFTDGVPEARDRDGVLYGYDTPQNLLGELGVSDLNAAQITEALICDVRRFCDGAPQSDDIAVVVIKAV